MPTPWLSCLALLPAPLDSEHPLFHPAEASVYFEVPDLAAIARAYERTSLLRMLADEEVHRALGPLTGSERFDPRPSLPAQLSDLLAAQGVPSLDELPLGELVGLSVSAVLPPAWIDEFERLRFQIVLHMAEPDSAASLAELARGAGLGAEGASTSLWQDGPFVVLLFGPPADPGRARASELESRLFGEAPSLADSPRLTRGSAAFSAPSGVTVLEGFSRLDETSEEARWLPAELDPLAQIVRGTLGGNLGVILSGGRFRMQLRGGRFVTESFREAAPGSVAAAAVDPSSLQLVSPEAVIGGLLDIDPGKLAGLVSLGSNQLLAAAGEGVLEDMEERYGFRPDRDLLAPLAGPVAFGLAPIRGLSAPDLRLVCRLRDPERFTRAMEGLVAMLAEDAGGTVSASSTLYRKVPMFTFAYRPAAAAPVGFDLAGLFKPTFAVLEDRLIVTLNSRYAKDEARRLVRDDAEPEAPSEAMRTLAGATLPDDALEVGFADWPGLVARLYDSIKSLAPLAESMGVELPFDPELLPRSETFTRFFEPAYHYTRRVEGGLLTFSESSLGPEMPLLLGAAVGAAAVPAALSAIMPSAAAPDPEPAAAADEAD